MHESGEVDELGWQYSISWTAPWSATADSLSMVRRRPWVRARKRPSYSSGKSGDTDALSPSYVKHQLVGSLKESARRLGSDHGHEIGVIQFDERGELENVVATTSSDAQLEPIIQRYRMATNTFDGADPACPRCESWRRKVRSIAHEKPIIELFSVDSGSSVGSGTLRPRDPSTPRPIFQAVKRFVTVPFFA